MITIQRLPELLLCDAACGVLFWKKESRVGFKYSVLQHLAGEVAGTKRKDSRIVIRLDNRLYLAHRVIWAMTKGAFPTREIDHINGNSLDNRIDNLRDVSRKTNQQNIREALGGRNSGAKLGVYIDKRKSRKKWRSCISVDGKQKSLGYFLTQEEACEAYICAKRAMHEGCTI